MIEFRLSLRRRALRGAAAVLLACLPGAAAHAQSAADAGPEPAPVTREYLHQQPADTALVFRFEPFEAEFESRLAVAGAAPFKVSGVPGLRIGPLFQFVEAVAKERPLVIEVALVRSSARARVDMQLVRFDRSGPGQELQQRAYRSLSHGLESAAPGRTDLWQQKAASLNEAATLFDRLGMQEPMLWSMYYLGHVLLERLGDALSAAEIARQVQADSARSRQPRIQLAAQQLEGRALLALASAGGGDAMFERTRAVLDQAASQAAEMDLQYERALAKFTVGLAYQRQSRHGEAFRAFDDALAITAIIGDADLANAMRRHAAGLHERLGNTDAAIAMMQAIETAPAPAAPGPAEESEAPGPADTRSERDSIRYLYEQGRLLQKSFRHDEAIAVLREALARSAPGDGTAGPIGMLLGQALFGAGRFDDAAAQLVESIPRTPASTHAASLRDGWDALAAIRRSHGEHDAVKASREEQAQFTTTPRDQARLTYQRGLDALARDGTASTTARHFFRDSLQRAESADLVALAHLARLRLCVLGDLSCALPAAPPASATPVEIVEAHWLEVQALQRGGRTAEAGSAASDLLEEVLFYRTALPGVLGAWYWHERDAVFDEFLALQLQPGAGSDAAARTLAALDAMREPSPVGGVREQEQSAAADRVRSLLAAREDSAGATAPPGSDAEIAGLLDRLRAATAAAGLAERARALQARLNALSPDETLLAWYVHGSQAHALVGGRNSLRAETLAWSRQRSAELEAAAALLQDAGGRGRAAQDALDQIGAMLLQPLRAEFGKIVLFLPLGTLSGVPLDALELDGRPLAASRSVVNLASLAALARREREFDPGDSPQVFLAGNRQQDSGDFSTRAPPSAELRAVGERFVGPGLTLRQGAALQWDEFHDARFASADLLHLAMPAAEDRTDATRAHLLLSDNADEPERRFLHANEIPAPIGASLAVLSQCAVTGRARSSLGPRGGLVAGLLAAGADAVIASLWPVGDTAAAEFMRRFYANLSDHPDIRAALAATKREYLSGTAPDSTVWAAFQLYID